MLKSKDQLLNIAWVGGEEANAQKVNRNQQNSYFNTFCLGGQLLQMGDHLPQDPHILSYSFSSVTFSICVQVGSCSSLFTTSERYTHRALQSLKVGMSWF